MICNRFYLSRLLCGFALVTIMLGLSQCGGGSGQGQFLDPSTIAVDSNNNRLFVTQARGELLVYEASSLDDLTGDQPVIDSDTETDTDLDNILPEITLHMGAYGNGTATRLFIMGMMPNGNNDATFNRVLVLDFDGTTFSLSSLSPIILEDNDATADAEADDSFADLVIDQANGQFFVTDATTGLLYVYSTTTGLAVRAPIAIGGSPRGMWLDGNNLYVCNASADAAEQVVSVINVTDFTENEINLTVPCDEIAVAHNDAGTILIAKRSDANSVLLRILDATAFTVIELPSADTDAAADGELASGNGISSTINDIVINKDADGVLSVYLSELDGNLEFVSIPADLSAFTLTTAATLSLDMSDGAVYLDTDGTALSTFFITGSGALLQIDVGTDNVDAHS